MNRMKSSIFVNGHEIKSQYPQFNGGERNVKVDEELLMNFHPNFSTVFNAHHFGSANYCHVYALLFDSSSVMDLLMVCDSLKRMGIERIYLTIPYLPYARQDRVCNYGEAHSLKVFCNLINSIEAYEVEVFDPHSDVPEALINNIKIKTQVDFVSEWGNASIYNVAISPDGGAIKKCSNIVKMINNIEGSNSDIVMESAQKVRNIKTGNIEKVVFNPLSSIDGMSCCVFDDIGDGMNSFIFLAKEMRGKFTISRLDLFITHAICSNGTDDIYKYFDNVYTVDYTKPYNIKTIKL